MGQIALNIGLGSGGVAYSQVALQSTSNWEGQSALLLDYVLTNQNSPATVQSLNLASGNTTISSTNCPALASAGGVWIVPPVNNGTLMTLKGTAGDSGIVLNLTAPAWIPFNVTPPASFVLSAGSGVTGLLLIWV